MTSHTDKELKSKNFKSKKCILAKDINSKRNLKSKPKQFTLEKGLFFGVTLIKQLLPKRLESVSK